MANVSKETYSEGRRGATSSTESTHFRRVFYIVKEDPVLNLQEILDDAIVPAIGDEYFDTGAECISREVVEIDKAFKKYYVQCEYDTEVGNYTWKSDNPLNDPWLLNVTARDRTIVPELLYEHDGVDLIPVQNSAGDRFTNPPSIKRNDSIITLTKNFASVQWGWMLSWMNLVNSNVETIWGETFAPHELFIESITTTGHKKRRTHDYYPHVFKLAFRIDLWDTETLDMGLFELVDDELQRIEVKKNVYATVPMPLSGGLFDRESTDTIIYDLEEEDFSVFGFPNAPDE